MKKKVNCQPVPVLQEKRRQFAKEVLQMCKILSENYYGNGRK